jgi:hypothetical protein
MISSYPVFPFAELKFIHKDGVCGVIIRPDKRRVKHFIVAESANMAS